MRITTSQRQFAWFVAGGVIALQPRKAPGAAPTVRPAWETESLWDIELDPHTLDVPSIN